MHRIGGSLRDTGFEALYDNLYPSRIIVGTDVENARLVKAAHTFAELLQEGAILSLIHI